MSKFQDLKNNEINLKRDDDGVMGHHPYRMSLETKTNTILDDIIVPGMAVIVALVRAMLNDDADSIIMFNIDYPAFDGISETDFVGVFKIEGGKIHAVGIPYDSDGVLGEEFNVDTKPAFFDLVDNLKDAIGLNSVEA